MLRVALLTLALAASVGALTAVPLTTPYLARTPTFGGGAAPLPRAVRSEDISPPHLSLRGGGPVEPGIFVISVSVAFFAYALQMLLIPSRMMTDHFSGSSSPMLEFWIRGSSAAMFTTAYALMKLPSEEAHKLALAWVVATGVIYPWNAKLGYIQSGLKPKYPMHYVPEILMLGLTVMGVLAF